MKIQKYKLNLFRKNYIVKPIVYKYITNQSLAIELQTKKDDSFAFITVCLPGEILSDENCAFIDSNNYGWLVRFLETNNIAVATGRYGYSGFCAYPEYRFNLNKLNRQEEKNDSN